MLELRNRYTVVTGASSGLGLEIARHIAKDHGGHLVPGLVNQVGAVAMKLMPRSLVVGRIAALFRED